ncbi:thiolase family protein [Pseudomonadota bacterium]
MKQEVFIVGARRSPIGKYGGGLSGVSATDLGAEVIKDLVRKNSMEDLRVDEVVMGNVLGAGLGQNPARIVVSKAGMSKKIPAYTVNKVCGSGLKSVVLASQSIKLGEKNMVIAGGMENMSQSPYLLDNHRFGKKFGDDKLRDSMVCDGIWCALIDQHMGITGENVARKFHVARETQDKFAYESHKKALLAQKNKRFEEEIVGINVGTKGGDVLVGEDEQPRIDTTIEVLGKLKPAFRKDGSVTAGNASSINDGAAAVLLVSEKISNKLKPMARVVASAEIGMDPRYMGLGSYYAAKKCLAKANILVGEVDLWEINEAFASQSVVVIDKLGVEKKIVNVNGGAIALGHPIGASGARILVTLIHEMKRRNDRYGVASLCIGGGQGIAMLVERT